MEGEWRAAPRVRLTSTLALVQSTFAESQEPGLQGNAVPQVPTVAASAGVRVELPATSQLGLDVKYSGTQWEDDRNTLSLRYATVVDAFLSHTLVGRATAFAAVENLFDTLIEVGRTPQLNIGLPRTLRAGVRVALP